MDAANSSPFFDRTKCLAFWTSDSDWMKVSFIEPDASNTRISMLFGNSPIAYGSSQTSWLIGCDQANDLNALLLLSCANATWSLCILPLVALESGKIDFFGSTAMRNSSFTTANKSFITAMHGSIVFEELVGNSSTFRGLSDDIWKQNRLFCGSAHFSQSQFV